MATSGSLRIFLAVATLVASSTAASSSQGISPADDTKNPLRYITNNTLSTIGLILMLAVAFTHTWLAIKTRTKYMLAMIIGEYCYAIGIAARFGLHYRPDSLGIYIGMYLLITLSPCGFIAAEYVLLGRLAQWLQGGHHLLLRPQRVTLVFVVSDIMTFLVQSFGGSLAASANTKPSQAVTGSHIVLAGLILQLISFGCFVILFLRFLRRMRTYEPATWARDNVAGLPWSKDWRALSAAMCVSCVGILVRSVYRTVEFSQGFGGHLSTTEVYFWVLDFIPLWIALIVYIPFWPGRFINRVVATPNPGVNFGPYKRTHEAFPLSAWNSQVPVQVS